MKRYSVQRGWVRYRQVGGNVEERFSDNPSTDEFDTYEEAREAFDAIDLKADWRTERACSGSMWRYDHRDAYKSLEAYEVDGDGYAGDVDVLEFEKYGQEDEER